VETYKHARVRLLNELYAMGWDVHVRRGGREKLKVPYATNQDSNLKLYFKPQAVYATSANGNLGSARSLHWDTRDLPVTTLVATAEKMVAFLNRR
jgi:hypothetical protein